MGNIMGADTSGDKLDVEFNLFVKSFLLIERYVRNNTNELSDRFRREHMWTSGHVQNWYYVLGPLLRASRDRIGYVEAIAMTAQLLKEAKDRTALEDVNSFEEIHTIVDRLISIQSEELYPRLSVPILGWVIYGGGQYDNHKYAIDAWNDFKSKVFQ